MACRSPKEETNCSDFDRWATVGIVVLTVMVSALAMSPSVADPDLWGHVQFGRDVIREGWVPETNPYTFTSPDYRWINHENLSEVVMAWTFDTFGTTGLLWGKLVLSLLVIGAILAFNLARGVGVVASCLLTIFVAWNLGYHWSFRPQLSSFLFFTCLVLVLQWSFHYWRDHWHLKWFAPNWVTRDGAGEGIVYSWKHSRLLWAAPFILGLWANSHGGFVAGLAIYVSYLGLRAIEVVSSQWPRGWGLVRRLMLMIVAAITIVFLNPYSWRLPMWLFESLSQPRPEILDWSSQQLFSMIGVKFWALIILTGVSLVGSRKSLDFTQVVLLSLTLWQAMSHFRHVPFFAILAGFWVGPHLQSVMARCSGIALRGKPAQGKALGKAGFAAICLALAVLIGFRLTERLQNLRVEKSVFPVDAFQYIADNQLGGRLVVTYDWAQYAIGAFCVREQLVAGQPLTQVAFDGRFRTCYPQEIVDMHFDLLFGHATSRHRSPNSPPCDPTRVLSFGHPDLVLVRRIGELSEKIMRDQVSDWTLLYQDGLAQLWGRRSRFGDPDSQHFIPESRRLIGDRFPDGFVEWPALPVQQEKYRTDERTSLVTTDY